MKRIIILLFSTTMFIAEAQDFLTTLIHFN